MSLPAKVYKADNANLSARPNCNTATELASNARTMFDPVSANAVLYKTASLVFNRALSGDRKP